MTTHNFTPVQLVTLLSCHFQRVTADEADVAAVALLVRWELLEVVQDHAMGGQSHFTTTDRGKTLVDMLCQTPVPTQVWADPRPRPPAATVVADPDGRVWADRKCPVCHQTSPASVRFPTEADRISEV